jgi:branched-chain amino acid transport system substrate-binding protein
LPTTIKKEVRMKKLTFVGAVLLIACLAVPVPGALAAKYPKEVVFGIPLHVTGPLASVGQGIRIGLDLAIKEINEQGGIKNMGGAKLKILCPDTGGAADIAVSETERLITSKRVSAVLATYMHGEEVQMVAQNFSCPCLQFQTIMPPHMSEKDDYVFRRFNDEDEDWWDNYDWLEMMKKETGDPGPKTIAFLYCDDIWCTEAYQMAPPMFKKWGYETILEEPYTCGQATFKPQIAKIKAAAPDHLILMMHTQGHIIFNRELMEEEVYLPYGYVTQGGEDALIYDTLPPRSYEYMFIHEDGDIWFKNRPWGEKLASIHKKKMGYDLATYVVNAYEVMWIMKDVLERAKYSSDLQKFRDNIRDSLGATYITHENCPDMQTAPDGTKWCPQLARGNEILGFEPSGHNLPRSGHGQISQTLGGQRVPLWPPKYRPKGYKPVWPIPPWSKR